MRALILQTKRCWWCRLQTSGKITERKTRVSCEITETVRNSGKKKKKEKLSGPFKPNMCSIRDPSSWASTDRIISQNWRKMNFSPDQVHNHTFSILAGASAWHRTQTHWTQRASPADRQVSIDWSAPGGPRPPLRAEHAAPTLLYREIDSTTMTHAKKWCSSRTATAIERERDRQRERERERAPFYRCGRARGGGSSQHRISVRHPLRPSFHRLLLFSHHVRRYHVKMEKKKSFPCSNYLVVILSQYLAAWTEASLSYFLAFSLLGHTKPCEDCRTFPCRAPRLCDDDGRLKVFIRESGLIWIRTVYSIGIIEWVVTYLCVCVCVCVCYRYGSVPVL